MTETHQKPSATVFQFPTNKIVRSPIIESDVVKEVKTKSETYLAENISAELVAALMNDMAASGLPVDSTQFNSDVNFVILALTSTVYRALNLDHPFQQVLDSVKIVETEISETPTENA